MNDWIYESAQIPPWQLSMILWRMAFVEHATLHLWTSQQVLRQFRQTFRHEYADLKRVYGYDSDMHLLYAIYCLRTAEEANREG